MASERRIVAAVNPRSGGNKGRAALADLTTLIGAEQVFDLTAEMRSPGGLAAQLHKWALEARPTGVRPALLVCGGDGTVSWLLTALVENDLIGWFSVATIPLGTANDFARVMGWNNAFFAGIVEDAVERLSGRRDELFAQQFDVWNVSQFRGPALQTPVNFEAHGQALRTLPVINYFSIGFDAQVAYEFNATRNKHPRILKSRCANMAAYGCLGAKSSCLCCCCDTPPSLNSLGMAVTIDGKAVALPRGARGVTAINVPSYANGTTPWGSPSKGSACDRGAVDDGRIEVFAVLAPEHMGCIQARVARGIRVGQGAVVEFSVPADPGSRHLYIQNDGEGQPFAAGVRYKVQREFSANTLFCPHRTGSCYGGGASRARFGSQPREEALPTEEELKELEADILRKLEALDAAGGEADSAVPSAERARAARVEAISGRNP